MTIFPSLYCPFPSAINPHVGLAHQRSMRWVAEQGLATPSSRTYKTLEVARFGWLAARTYPAGNLHQLTLITKWATWFFLHDDLCDAFIDPSLLAKLDSRFYDILLGSATTAADIPLAHALADLRQNYLPTTGDRWSRRFAESVQQCFQSLLWEATGRQQNSQATQETYRNMRTFTGGAYTAFDWLLVTENIDPNARFLRDRIVQDMERQAANIIGWHNDLFSAEKEQEEGNPYNLVLILQREENIPLSYAKEKAIAICNEEMDAFLTLVDCVPHPAGSEYSRYIAGLANWIRGHLDWMEGTARYAEASRVKELA